MAYGTYDRKVVDGSNSDVGQGGAVAINFSGLALGVLPLSVKTAREPMTVDRFGFMPVTVFAITVPGALGLYKYPQGLICVDLPTAIDLTNALSTAMIAHAADTVVHKLADTANFSTTLTPAAAVTDLATMLVQINLLQTAYAAHNVDAAAGSPTYHVAQDTTHALANATAVTTLATAIAKLNDMLTKYNLHDLEVTAHYFGHRYQAYKVLLATIAPATLDAVGFDYVCEVDNLPVKAEFPSQGVALRGVADLMPGDPVAIEVSVLTTGTGTFQPFFCWHCRAEAEGDLPYLVNRTPVKTAVSNNVVGD